MRVLGNDKVTYEHNGNDNTMCNNIHSIRNVLLYISKTIDLDLSHLNGYDIIVSKDVDKAKYLLSLLYDLINMAKGNDVECNISSSELSQNEEDTVIIEDNVKVSGNNYNNISALRYADDDGTTTVNSVKNSCITFKDLDNSMNDDSEKVVYKNENYNQMNDCLFSFNKNPYDYYG